MRSLLKLGLLALPIYFQPSLQARALIDPSLNHLAHALFDSYDSVPFRTRVNIYSWDYFVGSGNLAPVLAANIRRFNGQFAVKISPEGDQQMRGGSLVAMYRLGDHDSIVQVRDVGSAKRRTVVVYNLEDNVGTILSHIQYGTYTDTATREDLVRGHFCGALESIIYVHQRRCTHNDANAANFLVATNGRVKLIDFDTMSYTGEDTADEETTARQTDLQQILGVLYQMLSPRRDRNHPWISQEFLNYFYENMGSPEITPAQQMHQRLCSGTFTFFTAGVDITPGL